MSRPIVVAVAAGVVVVAAFLMIGSLFRESQSQRQQSCQATLVALEAVRETSAAGIRPVAARLADGVVSDELRRSFDQQRRATQLENQRRRHVIVHVTAAAARLRRSPFCN